MRVFELLYKLLQLVESATAAEEARCPKCGCEVATAREHGFDVTKTTWRCGCVVRYSSNFPGVLRVEVLTPCGPEKP